ncbi:MAG: DNA methyltransferase [Actinobacteria bacterium]|nr:MAG: DNA methyltransferase [Actinomycetota bacterium]
MDNRSLNKVAVEDLAAHDWYRFVLSYPPHLVRDYLDRFEVGDEGRVLDPFCGTGTTLVECKKLGVVSVGVEAHPMTPFASSVKVDWSPDPDGLVEHAREIAEAVSQELVDEGVPDDPARAPGTLFGALEGLPADEVDGRALRTLTPETQKLLLTNSISPVPLHKVLVLLQRVAGGAQNGNDQYGSHERLALAKALVFSISNLRFGPEVGVGPAKADAPVVAPWLAGVEKMAEDLKKLRELPTAETTAFVHHADSRRALEVLASESIDAVITSPPYPNEKDYTRTTRLETVLLGFAGERADLRALKQGLMRSNTRNVYKGDDDDRWVAEHPEIQRIADEIERRRVELGKTSGFEKLYGRVTRLYFGGMARHLAELRRALRPGARLAYVVGDQASYLKVMIRTGQLLAEVADALGYEVESIDLFRTRLATATKEQLREEVMVLRWPG